jgi:hypothetical protein
MADDGFHEIQLNAKQLVFLFMATTIVAVVIPWVLLRPRVSEPFTRIYSARRAHRRPSSARLRHNRRPYGDAFHG